jgi:uncharacterized protein (DUF488 family)
VANLPNPIWSLGHSTRSLEELVGILKAFGIETLVDIRTIPRSRTNPQFNQDTFPDDLGNSGIGYKHLKGLGGLRKSKKDSVNLGWTNLSFRGYADYMQTGQFSQTLEELMKLSENRNVAVMCAEAVPWRCHRRLVGDALLVRGYEVREIISRSRFQIHKLTGWAKVSGEMIIYPQDSKQTTISNESA